jgi:anaphase-promoting complex subunit 5
VRAARAGPVKRHSNASFNVAPRTHGLQCSRPPRFPHITPPARRCLRLACQQQCPHIVAYARLAIARFCLQHASAPPPAAARHEGGTGAAAAAAGGGADAACAGSLQVQAALRDVCALQHEAALAAAAPHAGGPTVPPPPGAAGPSARARVGELYNPSHVFGASARGSLRASAAACADAAGAAHLLLAAAWHQYGAAGLAAAHALVHLACYGGGGSSSSGGGGSSEGEDAAAAWAQLVELALEQQGAPGGGCGRGWGQDRA